MSRRSPQAEREVGVAPSSWIGPRAWPALAPPRAALVDTSVDQPGDVGVLQTRQDLALLAKALEQPGCWPSELLDCRLLFEFGIVALGEPDFAHAAGTDPAQGAPRPEPRQEFMAARRRLDDAGYEWGRALHERCRARVGAQQSFQFET